MGCCSTSHRNESLESLKQHLKESIQLGTVKHFSNLVSSLGKSQKNEFDINHLCVSNNDNIETNLIGFALMSGRLDMFEYIHKTLKADLSVMEDYFSKVNLTGLAIICDNNFVPLFEYYAPIYLILKSNKRSPQKRRLRETIELTDKASKIIEDIETCDECTYLPVHLACLAGHIGMIKSIITYASKLETVPNELNINYIDSSTGENCALIACKTGNYSMIKFLHVNSNADFKILNNNGENAIQVLAVAAKNKQMGEFFLCLTYLVEKIEIDLSYNYQETLLLLDYEKAIDYVIAYLLKQGVCVKKDDIEKEAILRKATKIGSICKENHEEINTENMFSELKQEEESSISGSIGSLDEFESILFQE